MEKQIVDVSGLFDARQVGYAQCIRAGPLVFIAGQAGLDERFQIVSSEFTSQARQALTNVRLALEAAGCALADIAAMTIYLTDIQNLWIYADIVREVLGDVLATSTAVEVSALALPGLLIEVTVVAVRPEPGRSG